MEGLKYCTGFSVRETKILIGILISLGETPSVQSWRNACTKKEKHSQQREVLEFSHAVISVFNPNHPERLRANQNTKKKIKIIFHDGREPTCSSGQLTLVEQHKSHTATAVQPILQATHTTSTLAPGEGFIPYSSPLLEESKTLSESLHKPAVFREAFPPTLTPSRYIDTNTPD